MAAYEWKNSDTAAYIYAINNDTTLNDTNTNWASGDLDAAMMGTYHPADPAFNISLKTALGPVAFVGMGEPEMLVADVMMDPANSTVMQRATTYGYVSVDSVVDTTGDGTPDTAVPDFYETFVRDWVMYAAAGTIFAGAGGGADFNASNNDDITSRLHNLLGVDFAGANGIALMVAGHLTDYANRAHCYKR